MTNGNAQVLLQFVFYLQKVCVCEEILIQSVAVTSSNGRFASRSPYAPQHCKSVIGGFQREWELGLLFVGKIHPLLVYLSTSSGFALF